MLRERIRVVALVDRPPNEKTLSLDDEVIRTAADHLKNMGEDRVLVLTLGHQVKWIDRVSDGVRENLRLLAKYVYTESILYDEYTGGGVRNAQVELSDDAIVIGGYRGVVDTAKLLIESCPPKLVDDIFVKGIAGGLPADLRTYIDKSRDWNSEADNITVHKDDDCARVLTRWRSASLLACENSRTPFW